MAMQRAYGTCPDCGKHIQVKLDGRLRHHSARREPLSWGRAPECDGCGMFPLPVKKTPLRVDTNPWAEEE